MQECKWGRYLRLKAGNVRARWVRKGLQRHEDPLEEPAACILGGVPRQVRRKNLLHDGLARSHLHGRGDEHDGVSPHAPSLGRGRVVLHEKRRPVPFRR